MSDTKRKDYVGYEYKEVAVDGSQASQYLDAYMNFGWIPEYNPQNAAATWSALSC